MQRQQRLLPEAGGRQAVASALPLPLPPAGQPRSGAGQQHRRHEQTPLQKQQEWREAQLRQRRRWQRRVSRGAGMGASLLHPARQQLRGTRSQRLTAAWRELPALKSQSRQRQQGLAGQPRAARLLADVSMHRPSLQPLLAR